MAASSYVTRCEPTYEELKLVFMTAQFRNFPGCEPTYEELKPQNLSDILMRCCVASLPMRN